MDTLRPSGDNSARQLRTKAGQKNPGQQPLIAAAGRSLVYDKVKKGSGKMVGVISHSINRHMAM